MKTIKQIADELGVSKTAVRKKIENLGLYSSLQKNGNQFIINEEQENTIKSAFNRDKSETSSRIETEAVSSLVSMLEKELEAKNEQIAQLQKLLDQAQQLSLIDKQRILELENKQEQETPDIKEKVDTEEKKSFLQQLFAKWFS